MKNIEGDSQSEVNFMTSQTLSVLEEELEDALEKLKKRQLEIGEAAGAESNWHDNAAFDHANMQFDLQSAMISRIEKKLRNVEIITPKESVDKISIGNTILVKFQDRDEEEVLTILGPADAGKNPGWISYLSPLGQSLINKKQGETIEFSVEGQRSNEVRIVKILPGDF